MSEHTYARSIQSAGMLELTRQVMLRHEDSNHWLHLLGLQNERRSRIVADVAGGTGALARWLLRANPSLHGMIIDSDSELLDAAERKAVEDGLSSRLSFRRGDARALPLGARSVDVAFVFGALQIIQNGQKVIHELARVARERVGVFWPVMEFESPHSGVMRDGVLDLDDEMRKLLQGLGIEGGGIARPPVQNDLSMEALPHVMATAGLRNLRVRGLMVTVDLEELPHEEYRAYRSEECALLEQSAGDAAETTCPCRCEQLQRLVALYRSRRDELIREHAAGIRKYLWDGGPVVVWIGEVPPSH